MPRITPQFETFAKIKVVGVGGSGGHAIGRMMNAKIHGVDFIAVNTDAQDLHYSNAPTKIHIGRQATKGLGAGMNPEAGRRAAEESKEDISQGLKGADMVFITCGLGGGTGSGASPIVAELARDLGALTIAVITKPFVFEGAQRTRIAEGAWRNLRDRVDAIVTIPNDRILQLIDRKTPILEAFGIVDDVLRQAVQGISDVITVPGLINLDFADVRAIMADAGSALMGIGKAAGEERAAAAAKAAISSPLLELSINGARGVLFTIAGGPDLAMAEVHEAAKMITAAIDPEARVIFGAVIDEKLRKGEVKVTVIATGFDGDAEDAEIVPSTQEKNEAADIVPSKAYPPQESVSFEVNGRSTPQGLTNGVERREKSMPGSNNGMEEETELDIPAFIRKKMR